MNIEFLKKLRTLIAMGGVIASTAFLSGCGVETDQFELDEEVESEENVTSTIPSEYLNDKGMFDKHDHLIVNIGGITYIIRECSPEIKSIDFDTYTYSSTASY